MLCVQDRPFQQPLAPLIFCRLCNFASEEGQSQRDLRHSPGDIIVSLVFFDFFHIHKDSKSLIYF